MLWKKKPLWFITVFLTIVILGLSSACTVGSSPTTTHSTQAAELRSDLISVNSAGSGSYAFFFEKRETIIIQPGNVKIKFKAAIAKPRVVVWLDQYQQGQINKIELYFRDKDQMLEYWLIK